MPELYIITGSNGAGKSSVGFQYIPAEFHDAIFDGDKLFVAKKKEFWAEGPKIEKVVRKKAWDYVSETFEQLVNNAIKYNKNFSYEGHFTNEATWNIPKRFKDAGYKITIIFLGLKDTKLSISRVNDRVEYGGHYVDQKTVEDNYFGNLEKLNIHFPVIDHLIIVDTSEADHIILASFKNDKVITALPIEELPDWFIQYLSALVEIISS